MSDWHDEFTEPMHDTPADKDPLIAAMEAAGYTYDGLESTNDNLRFFGEGGQVITMGGWHECEEWLNGVVFDDPQVMNRVEIWDKNRWMDNSEYDDMDEIAEHMAELGLSI